MENDLAGAMVWSLDTDDFHGDCAQVATPEDEEINFPLMRAINKAIVEVLEDLEKNRENVVPHGRPEEEEEEEERMAGGARRGVSGVLVVVSVLCVILSYC